MTNKDKDYLMELVQEGRTFKEIRRLVTCSNSTINNYIRTYSWKLNKEES